MQQQPYPHYARTRVHAQQHISQHRWPGMQRMKADAAAQWVIDWYSQQVIDIYHQTEQQKQITLPPAFPEEQRHEQCGNNEVQKDMKNAAASRVATSKNSSGLMEAQLPVLQRSIETPQRAMQRTLARRWPRQHLLRVIAHQAQLLTEFGHMNIA